MKITGEIDGEHIEADEMTPEQVVDVGEHIASLSDKQFEKYIKQHGRYMAIPTKDLAKFEAMLDRRKKAIIARARSRN